MQQKLATALQSHNNEKVKQIHICFLCTFSEQSVNTNNTITFVSEIIKLEFAPDLLLFTVVVVVFN